MEISEQFLITTNMTYKIPGADKAISQTNDSDFSGNIFYCKNMNFTEKGYMKLSSRAVSMVNESTDTSGRFLLPLAFFGSADSYIMAGASKSSIIAIGEASFTYDTTVYGGEPNFSYNTQGVAWNGKFYATNDTQLWYTTTGGSDWHNTGITLTSGNVHAIEVFDSRSSTSDGQPVLAISDGNVVKLYNTSYSVEATLTLSSKYSITDITFSFNKLGISTQATDEAVFFTWDGSATPNPSGAPVGSIRIISSVAYKSSFAILTARGTLKFFTGGGFQELDTLPYFYKNYIYGQSMFGTCMITDGDLIYINMQSALNLFNKTQSYQENFPGGILCYDPKVGIYHRYSPSQSSVSSITVTNANINTTTDTLTLTGGTLPLTGNPIKYVSDKNSLIGGLMAGTVYFLINLDGTNFRLATTYDNAVAGTAIDITSTGAGTNKFLALNLYDYGVSYTTGIQGAIKIPSTHTLTHNSLMFGSQVQDVATQNNYANLDITISDFKNIGYFVTPKLYSTEVENTYQKIFVKFLPLKTDDKIVLKYKEKEILGLPVSTTLGFNNCTWTSSTVLTTTKDISAAYTAINSTNPIDLECEIIGGAGAGQMSQVVSISLNAGTYTVTLTDSIDGATSSRLCDILLNNWKKIGEITSDDTLPFKEFGIAIPSTWLKIKCELRGVETTIEELQVQNATQFK